MTLRRLCSSAIALMVLGGVAIADIDIKRADELFAEGLALREQNLEQACVKFRESLRLNPQALGTLLNVALCDERQGLIASAVAKFSDAHDRAKEQQLPEYIAAAQEHIDKLLPDVPHLTLRFAKPPLPNTKIVIDEVVVPIGKLDKLPVDPGERVVVVSAPGRLPFTKTVRIAIREHRTLEIPELATGVTVNKVVTSSRRTVGVIVMGSGAAVTIGAVVLGLVARSQWNAQFEVDPDTGVAPCETAFGNADDLRCTDEGFRATNRARTLGTVGTVTGIVGLGAIGVGAVLWLTAPKSSVETKVTVVPQVGADSVGVIATGRF